MMVKVILYVKLWINLKKKLFFLGQVIVRNMPHVDHADWHRTFTGVSRRDQIYLAAKSLAGLYKQRLNQQAL